MSLGHKQIVQKKYEWDQPGICQHVKVKNHCEIVELWASFCSDGQSEEGILVKKNSKQHINCKLMEIFPSSAAVDKKSFTLQMFLK